MLSPLNLGSALKSLITTLHFNGRTVIPTLSVHEETVLFGFTVSACAEGADRSVMTCR
ncbi:MAG: hypothetical protein J0H44_30830 [Alphaproteobacteria bacterium]|nr:hypothetical protein [Alphaproteobacteria bacterium]